MDLKVLRNGKYLKELVWIFKGIREGKIMSFPLF